MTKCRYCGIDFHDIHYNFEHETRHEIRAIMRKLDLTEDDVKRITKEYRSFA